jgi:hypothetical protein
MDTDMMQLQLGGQKGTSSLQLSRVCRYAKEEMRKRRSQRTLETTTGRVFSSSHTAPGQSFAATATASAALSCAGLPPPLRHNQQVSKARNSDSSSLNDIFTVVPTIFQKLVTELNGAEAEENRTMAITKIVLKLMKQNCR